jgi:hypothetical protein
MQLRDVFGGIDPADEAETGGTYDDPRRQVAENRAQFEVPEYGDCDDGRGKKYSDLSQ